MINNLDFAKRLKKVMDHYQLSAAAFADAIKVQRSSISHLLSGRNKPSLDFVLKVLDQYKEVELYWLLNGKGHFPALAQHSSEKLTSQETFDLPNALEEDNIEKVIVFYKDGHFKSYKPAQKKS